MCNPGRELAQRGHLFGLDQAGLRGLQITIGRLCCVTRGPYFRLAALSLSDVREDQHEAAVRHWVATYLDHPTVWPRALIAVGLAGVGDQLSDLFRSIDIHPEVATRCEEAEVLLIGAMLLEKVVGQV